MTEGGDGPAGETKDITCVCVCSTEWGRDPVLGINVTVRACSSLTGSPGPPEGHPLAPSQAAGHRG